MILGIAELAVAFLWASPFKDDYSGHSPYTASAVTSWTTVREKQQHTLPTIAKNQHRKVETNIPRKGIARPQSQFPHSCVYERFMCSHDGSAYSAAGNTVCGPILGIYQSRTDTWMWKLGLWPRNSRKMNPQMRFSLQCGYMLVANGGGGGG